MKQYLLLLCMFIKIMYALSSQESVEALYAQGAYQEIIDTYQQNNNNDAATWFVLGNAAYCVHKYNDAYLYWLRAQRYGNAHIYHVSIKNMQLLQAQGFTITQHWLYDWLVWLGKYIGIYLLQIICLLFWCALGIMIYKRCRVLFLGVMAFSFCCCMVLIIIAYNFHQEKGLLMEDAAVYNGPNIAYYNIGSLPRGTLITVKDVQRDWIKIIYNDTIGWIGRTYVGLLETHRLNNKTGGSA